MLDLLYMVFFYPLEVAMRVGLVYTAELTGSQGWAVVVLSLVVNISLLPVYHIAETWQEAERRIQARMKSKLDMVKVAFRGQERYMMIRTVYRQYGYHPLYALRTSAGFLIQVPFFFAAFHLLSSFKPFAGVSFGYFSDLFLPDGLFVVGGTHVNVMPFIMTLVNFASAAVYTQKLNFREKLQLYVIAGIFLILLYTSPVALVLYWTCNNIFSLLKNVVYARIPFWHEKQDQVYRKCFSSNLEADTRSVFVLCLVIYALLLFLYVPSVMYNSDPSAFVQHFAELFSQLTWMMIAFITFFWIIFRYIPHGKKKYAALFSLWLVLVALVYAFVFTGDYGMIDHFRIQNEAPLYSMASWGVDAVMVGGLGWLLIQRSAGGWTPAFLTLVRAGCCGLCIMVFISLSNATSKYAATLETQGSKTPSSLFNASSPASSREYIKSLLRFSRTEHNVLIVMLDMFTGDHVQRLVAQAPELAKKFSGFIWYPDTLATGSSTFISAPSLLGGYEFTPTAVNARTDGVSLIEKINHGYATGARAFAEKGFEVALAGLPNLHEDYFAKHFGSARPNVLKGEFFYRDFTDSWLQQGKVKLAEEATLAPYLVVSALFKAVPSSLRRFVYDDTRWLGTAPASNRHAVEQYALLDSFPALSSANSPVGTFKFVVSLLAHYPWQLDAQTGLPTVLDPYPSTANRHTKVDGSIPEHLAAELSSLQALGRWFTWMKQQGVYDNTRIIVVSDHDAGDSIRLDSTFGGDIPGFPNALFMVKDFNAQGDLQASTDLMSNANTLAAACAGGLCAAPYKTPVGGPRIYFWGPNHEKRHGPLRYNGQAYAVDGTMFDAKNWKKIEARP